MAVLKEFISRIFVVILTCSAVVLSQSTSGISVVCQKVCTSTFQGSDQSYCLRGCRFAVLIDLVSGSKLSLENVKTTCLSACNESYGMRNDSSCAFGCTAQLPNLEEKRKQMAEMSKAMHHEVAAMLDWSSHVSDYAERMINCMFDQMRLGFSSGMVVMSGGSGEKRQMVIIRGTPVEVYHRKTFFGDDKMSGVMETQVSVRRHDDASEDQGHSALQGHLFVMNGRAAKESSRHEEHSDWLSSLAMKTGLSRLCVLMLLFTMSIILLWFVLGVCCPGKTSKDNKYHKSQKLSIYGDSDYLMPLSDKSPVVFGGLQKYEFTQAEPLPNKTPL